MGGVLFIFDLPGAALCGFLPAPVALLNASAIPFLLIVLVLLLLLQQYIIFRVRKENHFLATENLLYSDVAAAIPDAIWLEDNLGQTTLYVNPAGQSFCGKNFESPSMARTQWNRCIVPEDRRVVLSHLSEAFRSGNSYEILYRIKNTEGAIRWIEERGVAVPSRTNPSQRYIRISRDVTRRMENEQTVRASEQRLRYIVEHMPVLMNAFDENGNIVAWNLECERVTGYSAQEIIGNPSAMTRLYPDESYLQAQLDEWKNRGNRYRDWEWTLRAKDGANHTIAWSNMAEEFPIEGWAAWGIGVEVTAIKEAENSLKEQKERAELFLDIAGNIIVALDGNGTVTMINRKGCEILGCEQKEITGKDWFDTAIPEDNRDTLRGYFSELIKKQNLSGAKFQNDVLTRSGDRRTVSWYNSLIADPSGRVKGVLSSGEDVTDRLAMEMERTRLVRILEATPDLVAMVDVDGHLLYLNSSGRALFETNEIPASQMEIQQIFPGWDSVLRNDSIRAILEKNGVWQMESRLFPGSRQEIPVSLVIIAHGKDGSRFYSMIIRDIQEQKKAQATIESHAKKLEWNNRELQEFTYTASHDLKEPLRTISSFIGFLKKDLETGDNERARKDMQFILDATERMQQLIEDLLQLSRAGSVQITPVSVDLSAILKETILDLDARIREVKGSIDSQPLPVVEGDPILLKRVLQNLLDNALKFHGDTPPRILIRSRKEGEFQEVSIADNGIGMEATSLEEIFLPFRRLNPRSRYDGSGIGLSVVKKIMQKHGGSVRVESEAGKGTTFFLSFKGSRT